MPFSPMVRPGRSDAHCDPWPERRVQPAGGLLRAIAVSGAPSAGPAPMRSDIDQPVFDSLEVAGLSVGKFRA